MITPDPSRHGTGTPGSDPTEQASVWQPLRHLLTALDDDIARLYRERDIAGVRPRFVMPLIRLGRRGAMTIQELAACLEVTHSAMSQTVSALRREGLVRSVAGSDARTRQVTLTKQARAVLPFLEAEWRATEQAVQELESEIPYALSQVVRDLEAALARRSFRDRIAQHLDALPEP
ncbi:MarR family transcriptional regulator [Saccharopolyspora sp. K220]|uniref:MarR family winged helix-turn-helix transcriptional regulator n=1 Tax=Saccharopolyspora soli TaxID=2926618 RepID=UPI001F59553C|nr:MarR family transcriptional regulator [Saccharopolyspora soli]MCI2419183.1 MarR family transcriptional regulator [Saccharopolyspora soli]